MLGDGQKKKDLERMLDGDNKKGSLWIRTRTLLNSIKYKIKIWLEKNK